MRVPTDDGTANVEFDKADWKRVWNAIHEVLDREGPRTVDTANGPIDIQYDNPDAVAMGPRAMMFISGPEWSVAAQGQGLKDLYMALLASGRAAGVVRGYRPADRRRVAAVVKELVGPRGLKRS
jgi:hypothetical protein